MPAKPKDGKTVWAVCNQCQVIINSSDLGRHNKECCSDGDGKTNYSTSFILNKSFVAFAQLIEDDDPCCKIQCGIVKMDPEAMTICGFALADKVLLQSTVDPNKRVLLAAWPNSDKKQSTSALITEPHITELRMSPGQPIRISRYTNKIYNAASVELSCNEFVIESDWLAGLTNFLTRSVSHRCVAAGSGIKLSYRGKEFDFKVLKIKRESNIDLSDELNRLSLDIVESEFFTLTNETKYDITCGIRQCDKSIPDVPDPITFDNIGGLDSQLSLIRELTCLDAGKATTLKKLGLSQATGVLLHGPTGTGKSMIGRAVANLGSAHYIRVNGSDIYRQYFGESEAELRKIFDEAIDKAPSVVFIDNIGSLCIKQDSTSSSQNRRLLSTLTDCLDRIASCQSLNKRVIVIAATNKPNELDPDLRRPGRLDREVELPVPNSLQRLQILKKVLIGIEHGLDEVQVKQVADSTHGFVGADLKALCTEAGMVAVKRIELNGGCSRLEMGDFTAALHSVKPSAMRELLVDIPEVLWSDVGGHEDLKRKLRQMVEWPLLHPESFLRMGISPPKGILMYGPPGCAKTMIVKALATEAKLNFIAVKGSELYSKWVGESEKAVVDVFRKARAASPCIVFFDELDGLVTDRASSKNGGGVGDRVLSQLLTELDGIVQRQSVIVVGATNRPDKIDAALLRPGRFDRLVYVPLPDGDTRRMILRLQFRKTPVDCSDGLVEYLVGVSEGYSGAELVALCHEAALLALERDIGAALVEKRDFEGARVIVTPRLDRELLGIYERFGVRSGV